MIGKIGLRCICIMCLAAWGYSIAPPDAHSEMGGGFTYECDVACLLPGAPVPAGKYAVVSPVGKQTVQMIEQAPRLDTLDGKTIAVVGGSFMANITHPEIKRLILASYPTARVILLNEIGSAGPYPGPGVTRGSKDEFQILSILSSPLSCRIFAFIRGFLCQARFQDDIRSLPQGSHGTQRGRLEIQHHRLYLCTTISTSFRCGIKINVELRKSGMHMSLPDFLSSIFKSTSAGSGSWIGLQD